MLEREAKPLSGTARASCSLRNKEPRKMPGLARQGPFWPGSTWSTWERNSGEGARIHQNPKQIISQVYNDEAGLDQQGSEPDQGCGWAEDQHPTAFIIEKIVIPDSTWIELQAQVQGRWGGCRWGCSGFLRLSSGLMDLAARSTRGILRNSRSRQLHKGSGV